MFEATVAMNYMKIYTKVKRFRGQESERFSLLKNAVKLSQQGRI